MRVRSKILMRAREREHLGGLDYASQEEFQCFVNIETGSATNVIKELAVSHLLFCLILLAI